MRNKSRFTCNNCLLWGHGQGWGSQGYLYTNRHRHRQTDAPPNTPPPTHTHDLSSSRGSEGAVNTQFLLTIMRIV